MKKFFLMTIIFSFVVLFSVNNYAQTKEQPKNDKDKVTKIADTKVEKLNTVCPVSGEEIDEDGVIVKYKGKSYQVCCKKCAVKFNNNPEKYLQKLKDNDKVGTPKPDKVKKNK